MKKYLCLLLLFVPFMLQSQAPPVREEVKNVLVIHSYHQGLYWTDSISKGINDILKSETVEIHYEYLDTKRNSGEEYYQRLVEFESSKIRLTDIQFEVIICSDNNALRFIMEYGDTLFPGLPVIFCGINDYTPQMTEGNNDVTGVVEFIDYKANLDLIAELHPDRDNLVVIVDKSPTGESIKHEIFPILQSYTNRFSFEFYQDFLLDEVPRDIARFDENDIIYLLAFNQDRKGNFITYFDGVRMIRQNTEVPIYGSWDFYFGNGIVGGYLTTGEAQGRVAGRLAQDILEGAKASELPIVEESPNQLSFDYRELERFGINERELPDGAEIINRPPSLLQKYIGEIILLSAFLLTAFFYLLVRYLQQRRKQKNLTEVNRQLEEKVREKTEDLTDKIEVIEKQNRELKDALDQIQTLKGIIPICANCKSVRNDQGYWKKVEQYITDNTDAEFSHSLCPDCLEKLYPEEMEEIKKMDSQEE